MKQTDAPTHIDFLVERFQERPDTDAIIWKDRAYSYGCMLNLLAAWQERLVAEELPSGAVVAVEGDFSPNAVSLFLALVGHDCILVPLTNSVAQQRERFVALADVQFSCFISDDDEVRVQRLHGQGNHPHYQMLRQRKHPGLVLFSSGSTGEPKAAVHDLAYLLEKFHVRRYSMRSISFLLFDHIGGINTMLYNLSNCGCMVCVTERSADAVLVAVQTHRVELLPTSPTFINLILLSEAYTRYDLSSLKLVTYGTEPMPESTLKRFHSLFPDIRLLQTYGLSEVGIMRSKSKQSDSLWVKIGGEDFETRVVDDILQIKAKSAMLGYLNATSPFTDDGWFITGDRVEVEGEYLRFLGRASEMINVSGEKVYPAEVESVLLMMDNVAEAVVYGERHAVTGQIVCAQVRLRNPEDRRTLRLRLKKHCRNHLERFKIPVKIMVVDDQLHSARMKTVRHTVGMDGER